MSQSLALVIFFFLLKNGGKTHITMNGHGIRIILSHATVVHTWKWSLVIIRGSLTLLRQILKQTPKTRRQYKGENRSVSSLCFSAHH